MNNDDDDDGLSRYARHQREPRRAAKLRRTIERLVQFEQHQRHKDARRQRLREKTTVWATDEINDARQRFNDLFPSRLSHLLFQFQHYAQNIAQKFDVTFYDREPYLDVTLSKNFARALDAAMSAKDAVQTALLLENVAFCTGDEVNVDRIWTLNYMPPGGATIAQMENVDLAEAEMRAGPHGETVREMIHNNYRCATAAELDWSCTGGSRLDSTGGTHADDLR